jgi:hypothetical protein
LWISSGGGSRGNGVELTGGLVVMVLVEEVVVAVATGAETIAEQVILLRMGNIVIAYRTGNDVINFKWRFAAIV